MLTLPKAGLPGCCAKRGSDKPLMRPILGRMSSTPNIIDPGVQKTQQLAKICEDWYAGTQAVRDGNYLKKFAQETDAHFKDRVETTPIVGKYAPTIRALASLVCRGNIDIQGFDQVTRDDVDGLSSSYEVFAYQVAKRAIIAGITWVAVQTDPITERITLKRYELNDLVTYRHDPQGRLELAVFKDSFVQPQGEYGSQHAERLVVFKPGGGEVWHSGSGSLGKEEEWTNSLPAPPLVAFVAGERQSSVNAFQKPRIWDVISPTRDTADLNLVLTLLKSYELNILELASAPVGCFYGLLEKDPAKTGICEAYDFTDKTTQGFEWVEVAGSSIGSLQEAIKQLEKNIDELNYSLLTKSSSRTVAEAEDSQLKNTSFTTSISHILESGFQQLFTYWNALAGQDTKEGDIVTFSRDFKSATAVAEENKQIIEMASQPLISRETAQELLRKKGVLPEDHDVDLEKERLEGEESGGIV